MSYEVYFPKGLAKGQAFCNRKLEREKLKRNINTGQHTLLISPRRFGKSSLVKYTIKELNCLSGQADLFVAVDAKRIEQIILGTIKQIVHRSVGTIENAVRSLSDIFRNMNGQWIIGTKGVNLVLAPDENSDPAQNIQEALEVLENFLKRKKKKAVFFIDEIQEIAEVAEGKGIEGAIRHVAQETSYITFIFSGSKRHMLTKMFFDKSRPLYKLCDKLLLDKIHMNDYVNHLNKLARKKWGKSLPEKTFEKIFQLTELHPYYMNSLCLHLWTVIKKIPTAKTVYSSWLEIMHIEKLEISRELSSLSTGQKKILIAISEGYDHALTSKASLRKLNMSASSISEAVQILETKDYIEKNAIGKYFFIDPLIKMTLLFYYGSNQI